LEPVDDDLFLSFEDWKIKRFSESGHGQKHNAPPNPGAESPAEPAAAHSTNPVLAPTNPSSFSSSPFSSSSSSSAAGVAADDAVDVVHSPELTDAASTAAAQSGAGSMAPIPQPQPPPPASPHFRVPLTDRFNYASVDCSARVHTARPAAAAKSASNILASQRDRYMLSPCGETPRFVVVELCEDVRIDTVQLANFEFFSGVFREFTVSVAKTYVAADAEGWTVVGTYVGKNVRGVQVSVCLVFFFFYSRSFPLVYPSRSTRRRPFATFIATSASTFTRITPTSTTAPSRSFAFMASHISSSGSGIPGRKRVERGRTRTLRQLWFL
jgi:hypothetical protein